MHYGTFWLSEEPLEEPLPRLLASAEKLGLEDRIAVVAKARRRSSRRGPVLSQEHQEEGTASLGEEWARDGDLSARVLPLLLAPYGARWSVRLAFARSPGQVAFLVDEVEIALFALQLGLRHNLFRALAAFFLARDVAFLLMK